MHFLYFVKVEKKEAKNSEEARNTAYDLLLDNSFNYADAGYFGGGKCDWFVIGGRWSSGLQQLTLKKDFHEEARKKFKPESDFGFGFDEIEKHKKDLQKLWEEIGGTGRNPYDRDSHNHYGFEDDAMIMTEKMAEKLKEKYENVEMFDGCDEYILKNVNIKDIVGHWLVVVDYHG
jgi:hypothetical protein